ncbi:GNAT family N-acetyltransferase [Neobacillus drentensis]|uniref:GNAT family N-acetyltransferase n=1 Tax=Neobacillus drentensis TaxID=220684 RepID=UPI0030025BE1
MNIEVRVAKLDEIQTVHKLMLDAFEEYRFLDVPSSALNESEEELQNAIKSGSEKALICMVDEIPVGSSRFKLKDDSIYFSRLSVSPHARGKGIAKAMLLWLENKAMGYIVYKEEVVTNPNGFLVKTVVMEKIL